MVEFKKTLGFWTIVALTITAMLGTGIFRGIQLAAGKAGEASIIAWVLLAILTIYVSTIFGELVALFPSAGGVYEFAKRTYGRFASFIIGWITWMVGNLTTAVLIVTAVDFIFPAGLAWQKQLISIAIILAFNLIAFIGVEASGFLLNIFAALAIVLLVGIFVPGLFEINLANLAPALHGNMLLVAVSVFFIIESFFGWESASFLAEETKNAEKVIPRALVLSTIVVCLLGVGLAFVSLGVFPLGNLLGMGNPTIALGGMIYGSWIHGLIGVLIFLTLIGSASGGVVSSPRLLLAMGRDKLFPDIFGHIHSRFRTPDKAIFFQTIVTILVVVLAYGKYYVLLSMLVPLALIMYISVVVALPLLRRKYPGKRHFRALWGNFLPWIVALVYLGVVVAWLFTEPGAFQIFKIILNFVIFGVPIYILLTFIYDPDALLQITDRLAWLHLLLEDVAVPKKLRRRIVSLFGSMRGKTVLEMGAGVGTLTLALAESVGPAGKVVGIDISAKNLDILAKRLMKKGHVHVSLIRDEHAATRVHPDVEHVDAVFSVGHLGYVQDPVLFLKDVEQVLPEHGSVVFVEFTNFFHLIPNKRWLSEPKEIKSIFREAGLSVTVLEERGLLWTTVLIYGLKSAHDVPVL
ncbi:MAG: amino acid permease [Candidatus Woesearchaeota archaeon]